jgi:hypothetical protein
MNIARRNARPVREIRKGVKRMAIETYTLVPRDVCGIKG